VLGPRAFAYCEKLSVVTFESGSSLSVIAEGVFLGCDSLKPIYIPPHSQGLTITMNLSPKERSRYG
jgi:hypothetical protein